jgi:hypothetical protein
MEAAGSSAMLVNSLMAYTIHILEDWNYYYPSTVWCTDIQISLRLLLNCKIRTKKKSQYYSK